MFILGVNFLNDINSPWTIHSDELTKHLSNDTHNLVIEYYYCTFDILADEASTGTLIKVHDLFLGIHKPGPHRSFPVRGCVRIPTAPRLIPGKIIPLICYLSIYIALNESLPKDPPAWCMSLTVQEDIFYCYYASLNSNSLMSVYLEVTDGRVVRTGVSVTCNVLSWSGSHEFEPWSGWTWHV